MLTGPHFFDLYDLIFNSTNYDNTGEIKVCRICGEATEANNKWSHLVPELLGKNGTRTYRECDQCNAKTSLWESSLSGLVAHDLSILGQSTKNRIPKYRNKTARDLGDWVSIQKGNFQVKSSLDSGDIQLDKDNSTLKVSFDSQKLNPFLIYKSLLKLTILAMPDEDFLQNEHYSELLTDAEPSAMYGQTFQLFRFTMNRKMFGKPGVYLYRQKAYSFDFAKPDYILIIYVGRRIFQFIPPISNRAMLSYKPNHALKMELYPFFVLDGRRSFYTNEVEKLQLDLNEMTSFREHYSFIYKDLQSNSTQ